MLMCYGVVERTALTDLAQMPSNSQSSEGKPALHIHTVEILKHSIHSKEPCLHTRNLNKTPLLPGPALLPSAPSSNQTRGGQNPSELVSAANMQALLASQLVFFSSYLSN